MYHTSPACPLKWQQQISGWDRQGWASLLSAPGGEAGAGQEPPQWSGQEDGGADWRKTGRGAESGSAEDARGASETHFIQLCERVCVHVKWSKFVNNKAISMHLQSDTGFQPEKDKSLKILLYVLSLQKLTGLYDAQRQRPPSVSLREEKVKYNREGHNSTVLIKQKFKY